MQELLQNQMKYILSSDQASLLPLKFFFPVQRDYVGKQTIGTGNTPR